MIQQYSEICLNFSSNILTNDSPKIKEIMEFLLARIKESPTFIYLIEYHMCKISQKPKSHECCDRFFIDTDLEQL